MERKLVTLLHEGDLDGFHSLTRQGFRRSHDAAYRPCCEGCNACKALRVKAHEFKPSKTQRRLKNRYASLHLSMSENVVDYEHWRLFQTYVGNRHAGGSMADMSRDDFQKMVSESPVTTRLLEWREGFDGPLVAACLTDFLPDGPSAVYSYFSLRSDLPSLGTYIILALISLAQKADLPHVHLGYWVPGSPKMEYKARFGPAEICVDGRWVSLPKTPSHS